MEEASASYRKAIEQDPLHFGGYQGLGVVYRNMNRLSEAEHFLRKGLDLNPLRVGGRLFLAIVLAEQGSLAEALTEAIQEPAEWARLTALSFVHRAAGRQAESDAALRELEAKHAADSAYQIAALHAQRGDAEAVFHWLERAIAERDAGVAQVGVEPLFRPYQHDPRWSGILKRVGLGG
ncbi:MAG TPA: tetratricopeptide repeat protein, partial [Candidatus Eisenbacteria bacterium]|nr:tetratricopeptide repeat protein [Candidatus Eisenbacteria bacterium]